MNWEKVALGDVTESCLGKMLDQEKNKGEYQPYLANVNVRWGEFDLDDLPEMKFEEHEEELDGICARVFQHEFDHLEGKVYVDRVAPMRKMMLKNKLRNISEGFVPVDYKMFVPSKRRRYIIS